MENNATTGKDFVPVDPGGDERWLESAESEPILSRIEKNDPALMELSIESQWDRKYDMGLQGITKLVRALMSNTTCTHLILGRQRVSDDGAELLAGVLASNETLLHLYVWDCLIGDKGAEKLAEVLRTNSTLQLLSMDWNKLGDAGTECVASMLRTNAALTALNLGHAHIGELGATQLAEALKADNKTLRNIKLDHNELGDAGAVVLADMLAANTTLDFLGMASTSVGYGGAAALAQVLTQINKTLKTLELQDNSMGPIATLFVQMLRNSTLEKLCLGDVLLDMDPEGVDDLRAELDICTCTVDARGLQEWWKGEEGQRLLEGIRKNEVPDRRLNLYAKGLGREDAVELREALKLNMTLTKLDVGENRMGDDGVAELVKVFESSTTLVDLDLKYNYVTEGGAIALAGLLRRNAGIRRIQLHGNKAGEAGGMQLATALETNTNLTELGLHRNNVGASSAMAIGNALKINKTLTYLHLHGNCVSEAAAAVIFKNGAQLRTLRIGGNALTVVPPAVRGLRNIEELSFYDSKLESVDAAILALEGTLRKLHLGGNQHTLLSPPAEFAKCFEPPDELFRYFREKKRAYFRVKMLLMGEEHAGKTATLRMLREGEACAAVAAAAGSDAERERETVGVEVHAWRPLATVCAPPPGFVPCKHCGTMLDVDDVEDHGKACVSPTPAVSLRFSVFDLAGQVVYRGSHQCTFSKNGLYLCVVNATDRLEPSIVKVQGWFNYLQDTVPGAVFRLLLTHIDAESNWQEKGKALLLALHRHVKNRRSALELQASSLARRTAQLGGQRVWARYGEAATLYSERRLLATLMEVPQLQPRLQGVDDVWGVSNLTREGAAELCDRLVATVLDKALFPHVGQELPCAWMTIDSLAHDCDGAPFTLREELQRRAIAEGVDDASSFRQALWFWHEVGSLIHYRDVPQLSEYVFVDVNWILKLVSGLVEQAHKKTFEGESLDRLLDTGVLEHGLVGDLWSKGSAPIQPEVKPEDEGMLLKLLTQFDLLLPGPEKDTSFVPLLLPPTLPDSPRAGRVAHQWPAVPAENTRQAGMRFLFIAGIPPGLIERVLARCAAVPGCTIRHCWREGMIATDSEKNNVRVQVGERPDRVTAQLVPFIDVLLRAQSPDVQVACCAVAPFVEAANMLLRERYSGVSAGRKLLCPSCVRNPSVTGEVGEMWASLKSLECTVCFTESVVADLVELSGTQEGAGGTANAAGNGFYYSEVEGQQVLDGVAQLRLDCDSVTKDAGAMATIKAAAGLSEELFRPEMDMLHKRIDALVAGPRGGGDEEDESKGNDNASAPAATTAVAAAAPCAPGAGLGLTDVSIPTAKFNGGSRTMRMGEPVAAASGIWATLGVPEDSDRFIRIMRDGVGEITREFEEHGRDDDDWLPDDSLRSDKRRFDYVATQAAAVFVQANMARRDAGNEGMTLNDFHKQPDARKAKLSKAHVLALRLYTSNSYGRVNEALRQGAKPHPFAATTYYIHNAITKLRATRADSATTVRTFWRGLDDMAVSDEFMAQGGTEMGCMSTTEDIAVAHQFAKVGQRPNPLLLKVVATSLMDCGADLGWLSMYPEEKEVLFPPLTYLRPTVGEPVLEDGCTVITVQPRF
jgi:Ran GTPase-activating protein (RanGAP) involved in mRNA processing and transport/GTPase SAR1 family protein